MTLQEQPPVPPEEIDELIEGLEDEEFRVRMGAAFRLGLLMYSDPALIGDERSALEKYKDDAVDSLIKALEDEDDDVRLSAAQALGKIGDKRAVKPLIKALGDTSPKVRLQVTIVLGLSGDKRAGEPLKKLLEDKIPIVVKTAERTLKKLGYEWQFFSDPAREFVENLEAGSVSLKKKGLSSHQASFDSVFEDWETLRDFLERVAGIWDISFDIQPSPRESRSDGLPDEALTKLKKSYKEAAPLPPEAFVGLFVERLKNDPGPTGDYYNPEPEEDYESSSILDFMHSEFDRMYVGISGSRSDRFNSLTLRPKWHYEYLICAMKYCVESDAQKDLKELLDGAASNSHVRFLTTRLNIDFGTSDSDEKELSDSEMHVRAESAAATRMVKEAGITDRGNISYKNMFKVYIAILENLLDHELMKLWPGGLYKIMGGGVHASEYRNIFDFYVVSCKHFSSWR